MGKEPSVPTFTHLGLLLVRILSDVNSRISYDPQVLDLKHSFFTEPFSRPA